MNDEKPDSALPEKFEDFERNMDPAQKAKAMPKRRGAKPAAKAKPAAVKETKSLGGMEETRWSGVPMWRCPRCRGTTFDRGEADIHICKTPKFATEADE